MTDNKHHLSAVLGIVHDRLMGDIGDLYRILNFMTGDNLFTHQLPRAAGECKPYLLDQFKWLSEISLEHVDHCNWSDELDGIMEKYADRLDANGCLTICPIPRDDHDIIDPLEELRQMDLDAQIIVFNPDEDETDD